MRFGFMAAALLSVLAGARSVPAEDLVSASFILRGGSFSGGTAVGLQSTALDPQVGSLSGSIGQAEPLGFSGSTVNLTTVAPGFWPIVAGGFPNLDSDGDVIQAFRDNCPFVFNPLQTPSLDDPAIGFACLCGDVNDDGSVDGLDVAVFRDFLSDPFGLALTLEGASKCTVIGEMSDCDVLDLSVIRRSIEGPDLPPGIAQVCDAARGP